MVPEKGAEALIILLPTDIEHCAGIFDKFGEEASLKWISGIFSAFTKIIFRSRYV